MKVKTPDTKVHVKEFDKWIEKKKQYNSRIISSSFFKEREIWWVSTGVNVGFEEDGKNENFSRPVLIIKKFNNELFLGVPLSTKLKDNKYYVRISVKGRVVSALISQLRVLSSRRIWDKLAELDKGDFTIVLNEIKKFFPFPPKQEGHG